MFGKKQIKNLCHSCDRPLRDGQKVCSCGSATHYMTFAERTDWEVQQYRMYQQRQSAPAAS